MTACERAVVEACEAVERDLAKTCAPVPTCAEPEAWCRRPPVVVMTAEDMAEAFGGPAERFKGLFEEPSPIYYVALAGEMVRVP